MRTTASNSIVAPSPLVAWTHTVLGVLPSLSTSIPVMSKTSVPSSPNDDADFPSGNCSGITPMPIRLDRWIRSNDSAITARTPSSNVPLAAQSRDEPDPYSLPPNTTSGMCCAA
ncbi:Uncharacterised protein [Mycobacterium tuberculosis]|nr:Uncharacterised protein [Mycobacterium tuberculosis]